MLSATTLACVLLLPGFAICFLARTKTNFFVFSLILSYGLFILNSYVISKLSDYITFESLYSVELLFVFAAILLVTRRRGLKEWKFTAMIAWGYRATLIGVLTCYLLYVGPYLEVPADVWQHLRAIRDSLTALEHGQFDLSQPWYLLYSFCLLISGEDLFATVTSVSLVLSVIFGLGVFEIAREIGLSSGYNERRAANFGFVSTLLTIILLGTSVFAFFRYYVLAPVFLNFLFFLYGAYLICESRQRVGYLERLVGIVSCLLLTWIIHRQETMFLICLIAVIALYHCIRQTLRPDYFRSILSDDLKQRIIWPLVVCIWILGSVVLLVVAELFYLPESESAEALGNNTLRFSVWTTKHWFVSDPSGRVFETIGGIGITLAVFYFFLSKNNHGVSTITGLIIAPSLYLFNPIFLDLFLNNASHDVVWRLAYMFPIGFVGGYVIDAIWHRRNLGYWPRSLLMFQFIFLVPIPGLEKSQHLRWLTLKEISQGNSSYLWSDLIDRLSRISPRNVLTDPVTGYVLDGATAHTFAGFKFHGSGDFIPVNYKGYGPSSFEGYESWLFIANFRNGIWSEVGEKSGHWQSNVMTTSEQYSDKLKRFLVTPPRHFKLLWESDGIRVFEISTRNMAAE